MNFLFLRLAFSEEITVSSVTELQAAVDAANSSNEPMLIWVADGTYQLDNMLWVTASGLIVRSVSGNRGSVILEGQGMYGNVSHIFNLNGPNFTVQDMTLRRVANHAIQLQPGVDGVIIDNIHILDTYEQMVKIAYDPSDMSLTADNGVMSNCLLEYSSGIGPNYYIGGIDAHNAKNWIVRNNIFKNILSPDGSLAEHAIHFWSDSENTLVERNLIINCDRGIGFGLGDRGHKGGIIRNNMIYHDSSEGFGDVGIGLESAPGVQVYNNTILQNHSYPNAIEYRFAATENVSIENNLTNKIITSRDEGQAQLSHNITDAVSSWFLAPASGNLHLSAEITSLVDQGKIIEGLTSDFDNDLRPFGAGIDIGADEYVGLDLAITKIVLVSKRPFQLKIKGVNFHKELDLYVGNQQMNSNKYQVKKHRVIYLNGGKKIFKQNDNTLIEIRNPDERSIICSYNLKNQSWEIISST